MTPADGSFLLPGSATVAEVRLSLVLPGGRSLLGLTSTEDLPRAGHAHWSGGQAAWQAEVWAHHAGFAGLALVEAALCERATLRGADGQAARIETPRRIEIAPEALAEFVREAGLMPREVLAFLLRALLADTALPPAEARAHRAFAAGFLQAAALPDGFIEILATPETDGLFAQGWAMSLGTGRSRIAKLDGDLSFCEAEIAAFARNDILPPGQGIALYCRDWRGQDHEAVQALIFDTEGEFRRLELVRGSVQHLSGSVASAHVARMLPRLSGPESSRRALRRICRPRYPGSDTLSATTLPIAAAFEAIYQAPDGGLLAMGWLLDPLSRVERVILKSDANLYAPLQDRWHAMPRPDLHEGFARDPRFANLLDPRDTMHGFVAYAPASRAKVEGAEVYLELVLDDNSCLFRPIAITPLAGRERLPTLLAPISPEDPALGPLVERVLAPFLAGLPATPPRAIARRRATVPLGAEAPPRDIAAIMPFRTLAQLQPVFALLSGTPEAAALDLTLVSTSRAAQGLAERLDEAFRFYGLSGRLLLVPESESLLARMESGIAVSRGSHLLLWEPSALPSSSNWLARLLREAQWAQPPGLVSPRLVYEDGSICFGGGEEHGSGAQTICPQLGYPAAWLAQGLPSRTGFGAAEIALVGRAALEAAGGLTGRLFGDRMAHRDLADRLHATGSGTWCSGSVTFWALQEPSDRNDSFTTLMAKVDGALIAARARERLGP